MSRKGDYSLENLLLAGFDMAIDVPRLASADKQVFDGVRKNYGHVASA